MTKCSTEHLINVRNFMPLLTFWPDLESRATEPEPPVAKQYKKDDSFSGLPNAFQFEKFAKTQN